MKRSTRLALSILGAAILLCGSHGEALAQKSANLEGTVIYSLPSTVLMLKVEAQKETFIAGPYAQYAQKYLGSSARTKNEVTYSLSSIEVIPCIEADQNARCMARISGAAAATNFLSMSSQGLIALPDSHNGRSGSWRFPSIAGSDQFDGKDLSGNLTSTTATLYKTVQTEEGFRRVAVQQSQVVEKSLEKKAAETAQAIFDLRKNRVQIITGDTDATFSGEALGAAIDEITRLEQEYMSLFYGITETSPQTMNFDVIPTADNESQMYVAFRISDESGLVPANDMSGRPVVLQLDVDKESQGEPSAAGVDQKMLYYRIPATATLRILDGSQMLLQTRVPVYQLGSTASIPVSTALSK